MTTTPLLSIITITVIVSAEYEVFKTMDEANEFITKWCKETKDSWVNYHADDKLWSKDDPLWKMVTDNIQYCRNGDCFDGLDAVLDGYNESGLTKVLIVKQLNCDLIMYHKHSMLLETFWNIQWNDGDQMMFKEFVLVYFDENGLVSQVHHQSKKEVTDQFTQLWIQNMPKQDL